MFRRFAPFRASVRGSDGLPSSFSDLICGLPHALAENARAERDRWPLWLPVAPGTGIAIYFALSFEPSNTVAIIVAALGISAIIVAPREHAALVRAALLIVATMAIGFSVAKLRTDLVSALVLTHRIGPLGVDGRVESVQARGKGQHVVFSVACIGCLPDGKMPRKVRVSIRIGPESLLPGEWVHVTAVFLPPPLPRHSMATISAVRLSTISLAVWVTLMGGRRLSRRCGSPVYSND